jgi:hypothetical protein
VLELGVGGGANLRSMTPAGRVRVVHGVDPSPELRAKAETAPRPTGSPSAWRRGGGGPALRGWSFRHSAGDLTLCSVADPRRALSGSPSRAQARGRSPVCDTAWRPCGASHAGSTRLDPVGRPWRRLPAHARHAGGVRRRRLRFECWSSAISAARPSSRAGLPSSWRRRQSDVRGAAGWTGRRCGMSWPRLRRRAAPTARASWAGHPQHPAEAAWSTCGRRHPAPPEQTAAALERRPQGRAHGIEHGTVTAVAHGKPVEVTTLRRDVETTGGAP